MELVKARGYVVKMRIGDRKSKGLEVEERVGSIYSGSQRSWWTEEQIRRWLKYSHYPCWLHTPVVIHVKDKNDEPGQGSEEEIPLSFYPHLCTVSPVLPELLMGP